MTANASRSRSDCFLPIAYCLLPTAYWIAYRPIVAAALKSLIFMVNRSLIFSRHHRLHGYC